MTEHKKKKKCYKQWKNRALNAFSVPTTTTTISSQKAKYFSSYYSLFHFFLFFCFFFYFFSSNKKKGKCFYCPRKRVQNGPTTSLSSSSLAISPAPSPDFPVFLFGKQLIKRLKLMKNSKCRPKSGHKWESHWQNVFSAVGKRDLKSPDSSMTFPFYLLYLLTFCPFLLSGKCVIAVFDSE